ncbi:MAG: 1-acyl-sn-glycerol-3-phosphate acyltransferase [Firmicutes bacterium]|nr:1-acyl-sn-glycerol-3-phosphate acyltransferase [Bacillota bacterium]
MRTIIWFIRVFFYLISAIPDMMKAKKLKNNEDTRAFKALVERRVRHWALKMLKNAGVTVELHGEENLTGRPAIYIANHQSDWDIPVLLGHLDRPYGLVSKDTLAKIPLIRTWMQYIDCVFIDRKDARQSLRMLNDAGKRISEGSSFIIFPEGTRSRGDDIGEFKLGAFKTAFKYGSPIIPISIDGTYKIMEANNGKWIKPAHVIMTVLPAVETAELDKEQQKNLPDEIKASILKAREESRRIYKTNDLV